jgi:CHAT domain/KAP family P-loop domain
MTDSIDLEIGLRWRREVDGFDVSLHYSNPRSESDNRQLGEQPLRLDREQLLSLAGDEAAYGQQLSSSLFGLHDVGEFFTQARVAAQRDTVPLHLRLLVDPKAPAEFHALRWETLRDPRDGHPIATMRDFMFSRYLSSSDWRPVPIGPQRELSALIAVANPEGLDEYEPGGRPLAPVDVEGELQRAREAFSEWPVTALSAPGEASLDGIAAELEQGRHDILYLMCHGAVIDGESLLYLTQPDGSLVLTKGAVLVDRLRALEHRPTLVVLAASQTAAAGDEASSRDDGAMAALGPDLAEAGIAAVVAMQANITTRTLATFMPRFFTELKREGVVDLAMARARAAVADRPDWWVPVLFMRLRTGRIWYSTAPTAGERQSGQVAGYSADVILERDQLGILDDVHTLAAVLASNRTMPPVSVGLFGDWGSGKSFFMRQLRLQIDEFATQSQYAEAAEPPEPSFFCSEVVQIEFNAWHYVDANLWASLVTRIFEGLSEHIGRQKGSSEAYQTLLGELETARVLLKQTEERKQTAQAALAQARETRSELHAEQRAEVDGRTVQDFVERNPELGDAADQLTKILGIDQDELSLGELRRVTDDLRHIAGRLRQGWNALDRTRGFWTKPRLGAVLAFAAIVAVFGLRWLVANNTDVKGLVALIGSTVTAIGSVAASLVITTRQALAAATRMVAKDDQDRNRQLADAQHQVDMAQREVEEAQKEVDRIQRLDAGTVYRFIEDRYTSSDYRQHLGIVALIQRDFQSLSERLVSPLSKERPAGDNVGSAVPRIDRIVLYIDDLDRCPSDRVVKVLQAVHLLLAFPLFVVVVGVDSRWLLRSLRHEYSALLVSSAEDGSFSEDEADYWASTPQNYLEKIFQIPYWIRPMEPGGYIQLVRSLIASDTQGHAASASVIRSAVEQSDSDFPDESALVGSPVPTPHSAATGGSASTPAAPPAPSLALATKGPGPGGGPAGEQRPATASSAAVEDGPGAGPTPPIVQDDLPAIEEARTARRRDPAIDLTPTRLLITPKEQTFIEVLAPLIPTPRVAKRLINTYRLLRVSATDPDAFEGRDGPGEYQAVLLLLAIMNGFPSQAGALFRELTQADARTWPQFVNDLQPAPLDDVPSDPDAPNPDRQASGTMAPEFSSRLLGKMRRAEATPWLRLWQSLKAVEHHVTLTSLVPFQAWVQPVARYSFETGRVTGDAGRLGPALTHKRRGKADETT